MQNITETDIKKYYYALIKQDVMPTIKGIIKLHGSGSTNTVAPILRQLKLDAVKLTQTKVVIQCELQHTQDIEELSARFNTTEREKEKALEELKALTELVDEFKITTDLNQKNNQVASLSS